MSWAWLTEPPALFVAFIATLIGIPPSVAAIVAFVRPVVRRAMSRRAKKPAVQSGATVSLTPPRKTGGAVSTFGVSIASAPAIPITNPPNTINLMRLYKDYRDDRDYKESLSWSAEGPTRPGVPVYPG
jgi:hypothetical protein